MRTAVTVSSAADPSIVTVASRADQSAAALKPTACSICYLVRPQCGYYVICNDAVTRRRGLWLVG